MYSASYLRRNFVALPCIVVQFTETGYTGMLMKPLTVVSCALVRTFFAAGEFFGARSSSCRRPLVVTFSVHGWALWCLGLSARLRRRTELPRNQYPNRLYGVGTYVDIKFTAGFRLKGRPLAAFQPARQHQRDQLPHRPAACPIPQSCASGGLPLCQGAHRPGQNELSTSTYATGGPRLRRL
jgi:hypothetical protein